MAVISCVHAKSYCHVEQGANSFDSASMCDHFKRGCGCEGVLTGGIKAIGIVILVMTH